jgi:hypothetical protein
VLCLQSLVRHVHRVKGSGVSPSHLSTLLVNRIGHWSLNLHPSFNDNFVDIQPSRGEQPLLATSINLAARRSLLRCAICLPILDAARWWTRMRMTISRIKICPETIDGPCHARKKDNGVVDLEIRRELLGFWANNKCDGPWNRSRTMIVVLRIDLFAREQSSRLVFESNQGQHRRVELYIYQESDTF